MKLPLLHEIFAVTPARKNNTPDNTSSLLKVEKSYAGSTAAGYAFFDRNRDEVKVSYIRSDEMFSKKNKRSNKLTNKNGAIFDPKDTMLSCEWWDLLFTRNDNTSQADTAHQTSTDNVISIFNTVMSTFKLFTDEYTNAGIISFVARSSETARVRLYDRMVNRLANSLGFKVYSDLGQFDRKKPAVRVFFSHFKPNRDFRFYICVKKENVPEFEFKFLGSSLNDEQITESFENTAANAAPYTKHLPNEGDDNLVHYDFHDREGVKNGIKFDNIFKFDGAVKHLKVYDFSAHRDDQYEQTGDSTAGNMRMMMATWTEAFREFLSSHEWDVIFFQASRFEMKRVSIYKRWVKTLVKLSNAIEVDPTSFDIHSDTTRRFMISSVGDPESDEAYDDASSMEEIMDSVPPFNYVEYFILVNPSSLQKVKREFGF